MNTDLMRRALRMKTSRNYAGLRNPFRTRGKPLRNPWARLLLGRYPK